jgi:SAM-dependent methyltransferase
VGSVVLSGGCPDRGYFDWFAEHYVDEIHEHVAVELFRDEPPDLPPEVRYVRGSLCDLGAVADASIDLVFAGQVIEHLPPADVVGFLLAARRVLRPSGRLVLDSPNRAITLPLGWHHPEHILELTPSEVGELLGLAGFAVDSLTGLWLCRDPSGRTLLPLAPDATPARWTAEQRVADASANPDASFIWWAEASPRHPADPDALHHRVHELFVCHRPEYFSALVHPMVGRSVDDGGRSFVVTEPHQSGFLLIGPYIAIPPGPFTATFTFTAYRPEVVASGDPSAVAARVEIIGGDGRNVYASRELTVSELPRAGHALDVALTIDRPGTEFACETRAFSTGAAPVAVRQGVAVTSGVAAAPEGTRVRPGVADVPPPSAVRQARDRVRRTRIGATVASVVRRSPTLQRVVHR